MPGELNHTEQDLLSMLYIGKKWAFEAIYKRYWLKLYSTAYKQIGNQEDAEEMVQDVFMSLWHRRGQVEIRNLGLYLTLSIKNRVYDFIKAQISYRKYQEYLIFQEINQNYSTEAIVNYEDLSAAVDLALSQLPEKSMVIFKKSRFENQSVKNIAEQLNLSEKAVEYHITKSLKHLRGKLDHFSNN